jgi:hypothetical protein
MAWHRPSKAKGYFDDPERTAKAFRGIIKV